MEPIFQNKLPCAYWTLVQFPRSRVIVSFGLDGWEANGKDLRGEWHSRGRNLDQLSCDRGLANFVVLASKILNDSLALSVAFFIATIRALCS